MKPDRLSALAGEAAAALRHVRYLPDEEFEECPTDFLERAARHMRAASYSAHTIARRFEALVRRRPDRDRPLESPHHPPCPCVICARGRIAEEEPSE